MLDQEELNDYLYWYKESWFHLYWVKESWIHFFSPSRYDLYVFCFKEIWPLNVSWGRNHLIHIGSSIFVFMWSLWWVHIFGCVLAYRSYSFVCTIHHLIIIIRQTYLKAFNLWNTCQIYFVECVSKIKHILSVIHYTICGAVCFQFTHFLCDGGDNIYTLSYYHHQIGSMNYYPLFRIRSWNNGVRCMSFYILMT